MEDSLRSKGLYRITVGIDPTPLDNQRQVKWLNKNDEARGLIGMAIFDDLKFYIQHLGTPQEAWVYI